MTKPTMRRNGTLMLTVRVAFHLSYDDAVCALAGDPSFALDALEGESYEWSRAKVERAIRSRLTYDGQAATWDRNEDEGGQDLSAARLVIDKHWPEWGAKP